jgi:NAD(P)-dependent dehydrogenase (short-subunit alcohol dehydrogenase family)
MKLKGKSAIVTGGGSGIGRAICTSFVREGAKVIIADINLEGAKNTIELINTEEKQHSAIAVRADVTNPEDAGAVVRAAVENFGKVDILVNNAGGGGMGSVIDIDYAEWRRVTALNLDSIYLLSSHAIPELKKSPNGRIINVSSGMGLMAHKAGAPYSAAKAAAIHLTKQMALDFGESRITVNAICPGIIHTPLTEPGISIDEMRKWYINRTPLKRLGTPEDVASLSVFLASDESSFITGAAIPIDGGITAGTDILLGPLSNIG